MEYKVDDHVTVHEFLELANSIWPGDYDASRVGDALASTVNLTAREDGKLIGCLRIISDGYLFSSIPEAFVHPTRQGKGIGTKLFELAKDKAPTSLFFGAQPEKVEFYEKLGFEKSLQSFQYKKPR